MCELFSVTPATLARTIAEGEAALRLALDDVPDAGIRWPSIPEQRRFASATQRKKPLVTGVFGFFNGKKIYVCKSLATSIYKMPITTVRFHVTL